MTKMTIHRGLSELKVIGERIEKSIDKLQATGIQQKDKLVGGVVKKEDFEKDAKADYQSIIDLIDRRSKIKNAIVNANAVTKVTIAEKEMTIADAINMKASLDFRKKLVVKLENELRAALSAMNKNNEKIEANAINIATAALSKKEVKISDDDAQKVIGPYLDAQTFLLVDPLEARKKSDALSKDIDAFEAEVDAKLSEINAVTFIEVD